MKPWELMLSAGAACPACAAASRCSSASGAKLSGRPPMIARAIGSPSTPARITDCGLPPTATHTGSGSCSGRGCTSRSCSGARWRPAQRTRSAAAQLQQQLELLGEQLVVVVEVVAEEREGLDERAAAGHDLRAPARQQVQRGEVLEDPDRVVGAQHGDRAGQADAARARGRGAEDHGGRGDDEVGAVVLADAEDVEPDLVGQLDLLQQVLQPLLGGDDVAGARVRRALREGVDAEFHGGRVVGWGPQDRPTRR